MTDKDRDISHRTIGNPPARQRQISMASAYLDISGELFIQSAITAALLSLAHADPTFALMLARAAGASFDTLEFAEREDIITQLMAVAKAKRLPPMTYYPTEAKALRRVHSLISKFGIWPGVVSVPGGRYRLTFDVPDWV